MEKRKHIETEAPKEEERENMAIVGDEHEKEHDEFPVRFKQEEFIENKRMKKGKQIETEALTEGEIENMVDELEKEHDEFPVRFNQDQLIDFLLEKKDPNAPLPKNIIQDLNIYDFNPWQLADKFMLNGESMYFFSRLNKKNPNGRQVDRPAANGNGYWKALRAQRKVFRNGVRVGSKKSFNFYERKPKEKDGKRTEWFMDEYRLIATKEVNDNNNEVDDPIGKATKEVNDNNNEVDDPIGKATEEANDNNNEVNDPIGKAPPPNDDMKIDDRVLCMVFKKDELAKDEGNEQQLDYENMTWSSLSWDEYDSHDEFGTVTSTESIGFGDEVFNSLDLIF